MHKATWNQARISLRLRPLAPLLIKSGDKGAALLHPERPDMMCVRTRREGVDTVYIPGASLKGVVRSTAERILRSLAPQAACDPLGDRSCVKKAGEQRPRQHRDGSGDEARTALVYRAMCRACRTFGSQDLASRVSFADAYPMTKAEIAAANATEVRSGVAIDRQTGGPATGKLYEFEVVVGGAFETEIVLRNYELWQLALVLLAIGEIGEGFVRLGSAKSRGLGRMAVAWQDMIVDQRPIPGASAGAIAGVGALAPAWRGDYGLLAQDALPTQVAPSPGALGERYRLAGDAVPGLITQLFEAPWQGLIRGAHAPG